MFMFMCIYIYVLIAKKAKKAYASIGGGSPIKKYTQSQATLIQKKLVEYGLDDKNTKVSNYF